MKKLFYLFAFSSLLFTVNSSRALAYDIYVDDSSSSQTEDGSQENPFKTISAAITFAEGTSDKRSIFIFNGTYNENFEINKALSLTGESKDGTIINGHGKDKTINIKETSSISSLTVSEGYTGIFVSAGAGATITDCRITESEKMGIEIEKSSTSNSEKVTVRDCDISNGDGKGFYINKRRVLIENNNVINNDEEGIDIRAGAKGKIKKNTIAKNGESGIELIVGSTGLKISSNKIKGNSASGIAHQFYKDSKKTGSIKLEKNKIQKNDNYGILCATPSGGDPKPNYWTKSIDLARNIFSSNGTNYSKRCGFPIALKK